jgi:hypothetical protein
MGGVTLKKRLQFNEANSLGPSDPAGVILKGPSVFLCQIAEGQQQEALQKKKRGSRIIIHLICSLNKSLRRT